MNRKNLIITLALLLASVVFTAAVMKYDVAPIGPGRTAVGFATLNRRFQELVGYDLIWYRIADVLGIFVILVCAALALTGFMQLIKRKSLLKVDHNILVLGGLYLMIFVLYVIFEKAAINYRPVIMPDETFPSASFPSSHTLMALVVIGGALLQLNKYIKKRSTRTIIRIDLILIMVMTVIARTLSGTHWLTDIIASLLISATLLMAYVTVNEAVSDDR